MTMSNSRNERQLYITKDNSGIKKVRSINLARVSNQLGLSRCSLLEVKHQKLQKGHLHLAVICGRRRWARRRSGINSKLGYNLGVLCKKDHTPITNRYWGCTYLEARVFGYLRLTIVSRQQI